MRNARLEAKLIRKSLKDEAERKAFLAYMRGVNDLGGHRVVDDEVINIKGWSIVFSLFLLLLAFVIGVVFG